MIEDRGAISLADALHQHAFSLLRMLDLSAFVVMLACYLLTLKQICLHILRGLQLHWRQGC